MSTNHKWNVLKIMRFFTRINKPFNAETYIRFITPNDGPPQKGKNTPSPEEVRSIIRRYVENGWTERIGKDVVITQKGLLALNEWEKKVAIAAAEKREQDYLAKGFARPRNFGPDGKYLPGGRNPRKQKKETQK